MTRGKVVDELAETAARPSGAYVSILSAGESVIGKKGFPRATIEEIAAEANVTEDVFYAHFAGKGALLRALNDRFVEQMLTAIDQSTRSGSWSSSKARDLIEVTVRSVLDVVFGHEALVRAFLAHGATDRSLAEGLKKIGSTLAKRISESLGECRDVESVDTRAVAFSLLLTVSLAHHSVLVGEEWSGVFFSREELLRETATAVSAYLGLDLEGELDVEPSSRGT